MEEQSPTIEMSAAELERNRAWWKVSEMLDKVIGMLMKENKK